MHTFFFIIILVIYFLTYRISPRCSVCQSEIQMDGWHINFDRIIKQTRNHQGCFKLSQKTPASGIIGGLHSRHVGGQNKKKIVHKVCIKMEVNSQRRKILLQYVWLMNDLPVIRDLCYVQRILGSPWGNIASRQKEMYGIKLFLHQKQRIIHFRRDFVRSGGD